MKTKLFVFCVFAIAIALGAMVVPALAQTPTPAPALNVVQTDAGQVAAAKDSTADVRIFKMIPYAAPPVGDLRWRPPQPVTPWQGVRKADSFSPACMNSVSYGPTSVMYFGQQGMSEDCLYLNVWTPAKTATNTLPVFVIFSGPTSLGGGAMPFLDGTGLAKKGVVYVNLNYRVSVFGWLMHPDLEKEPGSNNSSGNYHYLDIIAALKWVQKNIAAFGGDPNNVTIWGYSTAPAYITNLTASPLAKGLFQRAGGADFSSFYSFESSTLSPFPALTHAAATQAWGDWAKNNFTATTISELRARSSYDLLKPALPYPAGRAFDGYVVADYVDSVYAKGQQIDVPLLIGWSKDTGWANPLYSPAQASTVVSYTALINAQFGKSADQFLQLYPAKSDAEALAQSYAYFGDTGAWSQWEWAKAHNKTGKTKSYVYNWTYTPPWNPGLKFAEGDPTQLGAFITNDLGYAFQNLNAWGSVRQYTDADTKLSDMMASYWVNFAKTGDPNGPGLPTWPVFDEKVDNSVMYFGAQSQPGPVPNKARLEFLGNFWRSRALAAPAATPVPPTTTSLPSPTSDIPAGMGALSSTNFLGGGMNVTLSVNGKSYVIPTVDNKPNNKVVVYLPPGKYTFSATIPRQSALRCELFNGCTVEIKLGQYTYLDWY